MFIIRGWVHGKCELKLTADSKFEAEAGALLIHAAMIYPRIFYMEVVDEDERVYLQLPGTNGYGEREW